MMRIIALLTFGFFVSSSWAMAATNYSIEELVNIAGKQRMLSQRIAKNYFYIGQGVNVSKAKKQLKSSLTLFNKQLAILKESIKDEEVQNMIEFVQMMNEEFATLSAQKYTTDNGALVLDSSESMLEGSQFIVSALTKTAKKQSATIVDISGRQRMLSQRIAKYYISYQAGIRDNNSIVQMKEAVKLFNTSHQLLMKNKTNSAKINKELQEVDRLWRIVYKFYLNIEKGGLPIIVYNTTDRIMKKMNTITGLYVEIK